MPGSDYNFSISILLLDGEDTSRRLLCETLEALGFKILESTNINDALKILAAQKIDLVMMDVILPDGNGAAFMMKLKDERAQIPIIVLTSVLDSKTRDEILSAGADGVLSKPFRISLVEDLIITTLMKYDSANVTTPKSMRKVLVIDDDNSLLTLLIEAIKVLGYDVVACRNGADAREAFANEKFDLVISDFMLPDVNGVILLRELKKLNPALPIVIVTGYPWAYTPAMAKADGIDGYLGKPFRINQLEQVMAGLLFPEKSRNHTK